MHSIAIIGSGPTAIYTLNELLKHSAPLTITMFEAQAQAGKGMPYHQDWNEREMLANISSVEIPPVTETLVDWLRTRSERDLYKMGMTHDDIAERAFFPRLVLGNYFHAQLDKLVQAAALEGSQVTVKTCHRVTDVSLLDDAVEVMFCDGHERHAFESFDYVVMATGHAWPTETEVKPGYFSSPWPSSALAAVKDCHIGIRGTSLSAIDALVALATARGSFLRDGDGELRYHPEPGTEAFRITMLSRKGLLPEADFYHTIPYEPLRICTKDAVESLIAQSRTHLLDDVFTLLKRELAACDPAYAEKLGLSQLTLEEFSSQYFEEREQHDPFVWAVKNLAEARDNFAKEHTIPWRYAILRMHETVALAVPHLHAEDHKRFDKNLKAIFMDDYATVPHESIERLLAMHHAGKLDIMAVGEEYELDTENADSGAVLTCKGERIHFPAFIEAMGQRVLSVRDFPFPTLWKQGVITEATVPFLKRRPEQKSDRKSIGGIALDKMYHPVSPQGKAARLYCLSLPFLLGQYPFAQGITSSYDMGKTVANDLVRQLKASHRMDLDTAPPLYPLFEGQSAIT